MVFIECYVIILTTWSYVALVIAEQPLPMVITKGKALEEPIVVQLLTGANVTVQSISPVKVILNMDSSQLKGMLSNV